MNSKFLPVAEDGVLSVAANLEQLNLQKDDLGSEPEDNASIIIPDHLQPRNPECLNLSFGSFGSGTNAAFSGSGPFASRPLKSDLEETSAATDASTIEPSDARYVSFGVYFCCNFLVTQSCLKDIIYIHLAEVLTTMAMSILLLLQKEIWCTELM